MSPPYRYHSLADRHSSIIQKYKMRTLLCIVSVTTCVLVILCLTNAHPMVEDPVANESSSATEASSSPISSTDPSSSSSGSTSAGSLNASSTLAPLIHSKPSLGYLNGSRLVITNVVKTLEFDVDLEDDDSNSTETSSESSAKFLETDIQVLDPALLEEVVSELSSTHENLDKSIDGTKSSSEDDDGSS